MSSLLEQLVDKIREQIFNRFARAAVLEKVVLEQLGPCLRTGVCSDFQAGYLEPLRWSLSQSGYPETAQMIAARAMVEGWIIASPEEEAV